MYDLLIANGTVVNEDGECQCDVAVAGEHVVALLPHGSEADAVETIDATGRHVIPGGIDTHTHIEWPFGDDVTNETFRTATRAALVSGTTTVIDFAPLERGSSPLAAVEQRAAVAAAGSACDYSFHAILNSADDRVLAEIPQLVADGIGSFKIYTTFDDNRVDDAGVWALMKTIIAAGGVPGFHAENDSIVTNTIERLVSAEELQLRHFPASRPEVSESEAIAMVTHFARVLDGPVWIYHLTCVSGLEVIRQAQEAGIAVAAETCPHYLVFDDSVFDSDEAWRYVITPPIRGAEARPALWRGLADGTVAAVGSDHCAYSRAQKGPERSRFIDFPMGAPGVEMRLPVLLSEGVAAGRLSMSQLVRATSTGAARTLGLYPRKGLIAAGSDADLVVVDLDQGWAVSETSGTTDYSIYAGFSGTGAAVLTVRRGRIVARDGKYVGGNGGGQFLPRRVNLDLWPANAAAATLERTEVLS